MSEKENANRETQRDEAASSPEGENMEPDGPIINSRRPQRSAGAPVMIGTPQRISDSEQEEGSGEVDDAQNAQRATAKADSEGTSKPSSESSRNS